MSFTAHGTLVRPTPALRRALRRNLQFMRGRFPKAGYSLDHATVRLLLQNPAAASLLTVTMPSTGSGELKCFAVGRDLAYRVGCFAPDAWPRQDQPPIVNMSLEGCTRCSNASSWGYRSITGFTLDDIATVTAVSESGKVVARRRVINDAYSVPATILAAAAKRGLLATRLVFKNRAGLTVFEAHVLIPPRLSRARGL
jgi:hypothetical protein